jgi:hypothetical protein
MRINRLAEEDLVVGIWGLSGAWPALFILSAVEGTQVEGLLGFGISLSGGSRPGSPAGFPVPAVGL